MVASSGGELENKEDRSRQRAPRGHQYPQQRTRQQCPNTSTCLRYYLKAAASTRKHASPTFVVN